jgi:perosamine synthetase
MKSGRVATSSPMRGSRPECGEAAVSIPVESFLVTQDADIRSALAVIDRNGHGTAFAVDGQRRFRGLLTDGDIRRAFLQGAGLDTPVKAAMRRDCVTLPHDAAPEIIVASLGETVRIIPLLDPAGRPVDYASQYRYRRFPVTEPLLNGNELNYVTDCVRTNWLSSQGPFVKRFEEEFAARWGCPEAVAVSNGTAALHLALLALGVGAGDEVILPDLTFAASANAVLYVGAEPVLVDVDRDTWTISPEAVERAITPRTKAILPVHLYGQPCDMRALMTLAEKHRLLVIEDAAEGLGARYHGRWAGQFGDAAAFSFYGNKLITTGEGGMVTFKEKAATDRARRLRDHGMAPARRYWHDEVGYNYRLTNIQAAIGVAQLERIESFLARKLEIGNMYQRALSCREEVVLPVTRPGTINVFWLYSIIMSGDHRTIGRDDLMDRLLLSGVETRPLFHPLHVMPPYRQYARSGPYPNAEWLAANGLSLPSAVTLRDEDVRHIADTIKRVLDVRIMGQMAMGRQ